MSTFAPPSWPIVFDSCSQGPWESLKETSFLDQVFHELSLELSNRFGDYRFFILSSQDTAAIPRSAALSGKNKVLVWISDESGSIPAHVSDQYHAIFKSYIRDEAMHSATYAFPLGYMRGVPALPARPPAQRSIDLFFSGNLNANRFGLYRQLHPFFRALPEPIGSYAARAVRRIRWPRLRMDFSSEADRSFLRFTSGFSQGLSPEEYGQALADSKIVLCPKGFQSPETFRHMEAMRAGAVIISEPLPQNHLYRDSPIQICSNWRDGLALAQSLLQDHARLQSLHERTLAWWHDVCSERATARFVADTLRARAALPAA